jgi:hypothetical protein
MGKKRWKEGGRDEKEAVNEKVKVHELYSKIIKKMSNVSVLSGNIFHKYMNFQ